MTILISKGISGDVTQPAPWVGEHLGSMIDYDISRHCWLVMFYRFARVAVKRIPAETV